MIDPRDIEAVLFEASEKLGGQDLLDMATSHYGDLAAETRERLLALIGNPTVETWDAAYDIIIDSRTRNGLGLTVWQAMLHWESDGCPHAMHGRPGDDLTAEQRWGGYAPEDPFTVINALYQGLVHGH